MSPSDFAALLPAKPYCTDDCLGGVTIRCASAAVKKRFIQMNSPHRLQWIVLDLDREDAAEAWLDANVPEPNIIAVNPSNGHAHYYYLLETPVHNSEKSNSAIVDYHNDVVRGLTRRLKADPNFRGPLCKNPVHSAWNTHWGPKAPYSLADLNAWLDTADKWRDSGNPLGTASDEIEVGTRNCSLFDLIRKWAYRQMPMVRREGYSLQDLIDRLIDYGSKLNSQIKVPLGFAELKGIAKSIAKWCWRRLTGERFSAKQRAKAMKRWAGHTKSEPWKQYGFSRTTYYRLKKAGNLPVLQPESDCSTDARSGFKPHRGAEPASLTFGLNLTDLTNRLLTNNDYLDKPPGGRNYDVRTCVCVCAHERVSRPGRRPTGLIDRPKQNKPSAWISRRRRNGSLGLFGCDDPPGGLSSILDQTVRPHGANLTDL